MVAGEADGKLFVWGGIGEGAPTFSGTFDNGAVYDPDGDSWSGVPADPLELNSVDSPTVQAGPYAVLLKAPLTFEEKQAPASLYLFDPTTEQWRLASKAGAPTGRSGAVVAYLPAAQQLLVWGGYGKQELGDGALYSVVDDSWQPMNEQGAPSPRWSASSAVLTTADGQTKVVVWGGKSGVDGPTASGGVYDVSTGTWQPMQDDACAPPALNGSTFTAFGDGRSALLWGGARPDTADVMPEQGWVYTLSP
jgi:hypothetical protein